MDSSAEAKADVLLETSSTGAEQEDGNKSVSDVSDVEMDDSKSIEESEQLETQDTKDEEEDNSLVVYHCWICSVEFIDKVSIIRHLKEWHKDRPEVHHLDRLMKVPVCMECGVQGPCEHQDGERHEEDDGATAYMCRPRFLICISCPETFLNAEAVRLHRSKAHPDEPSHQCTYCPEAFFDHPSLVNHNRIHLGGRPYICTTCGNRFSKISDLKRHERIHSGEKPFKCMQCHQTFTQKSSLEKHARIHARRSGHLACLLCGLLFKEKEALREHAQEMHKGNNFICGVCGKMYTEERYLILHERTHDSDNSKPFACKYCDRRFTQQHLLSKHEKKMHLSKREIKCHLCNKVFKRNENLTRHMGSLTRHFKAQHQQLRPHTCPICRRAFTRKSLLRKHVERFHVQKARELVSQRGKFFRCKLCLKLLRKTGKRQHERHHRSKGDVWEGSLEETIDGSIGADSDDLNMLLGPEVAKLLSKKRGGRTNNDSGGVAEEEEEEDHEDEDDPAEDNNEDDNEEEEEEEDEDENGEDVEGKAGSNDDGEEKNFEKENDVQEPEKLCIERPNHTGGPVFPEFRHLGAGESSRAMQDSDNVFSDIQDLKEDGDLLNYRKVGIVESAQAEGVCGKRRLTNKPNQYEMSSNSQSQLREAEDEILPKRSNLSQQGEVTPGHSILPEEPKAVYHKSKLPAESENQGAVIQPQEPVNEGSSLLADYHSHYPCGKEDLPHVAEDLRLQQGFGNERGAHSSETTLFGSRNRKERALENHPASEQNLIPSYSERDCQNPTPKGMQYMEESGETKRPQSHHRELEGPQYSEPCGIGESSYHEAMNTYQRLSQASHSNVSDPHYVDSYQRDLKEPGAYARHQMVESGPPKRNQSDREDERAYRETDSVYQMVDPGQRVQGCQGSAPNASLEDSRYREAAAAYAMMGIAGYPDSRMVASRSHGQNYFGMYPWYNETALTQAMMESRPTLQGMMGSLGYAGGSSFVDPRLREHHQAGSREDMQYPRNLQEMDTSREYARSSTYSQEMMNAIARQKDFDGSGHQRYRGQGGSLLDQQYKAQSDLSRGSQFAHGVQSHSMMGSEQHQDAATSRRNQGYSGPGSSSHGQGNSIHRSWM
ncbi:zinc finger protein 768 [Elysia marginata]|uniref:Zinc finger protein 768 n=1 Tax=Elysia marginata TaxID=1093978 RepID=A0AAV4GRQ1_9GAST|nr:zinc finger protein 768 [Elysia marginata]